MSFASSLLSIILDFFKSFMGILGADIDTEMRWLGLNVSLLIYSWANSISGYGIIIPTLLVAVVGITIVGLLVVFMFFDSAKDLVGA